MDRAIVRGKARLHGTVRADGAKNAVLPVLAAALLPDTPSCIHDVPLLDDVLTMREVLESLGSSCSFDNGAITINNSGAAETEAPYELVRRMRASFLVMGPLLAKYGKARISMPGGCAIGARPIDLHLKGFELLGARVTLGDGFVEVSADGLLGTRVYLDFPSVGATENIMMAAALAKGLTVIENAAEEPEIVDLANFISNMGAEVRGAGTNVIRVEGRPSLKGVDYTVIPDRIEAGTYLVAGAMTGGDVLVENVVSEHLKPLIAKLKEVGATITEEDETSVRVIGPERLIATDIKTLPYPGFPTDMQAQMMALLCRAEGTSIVTETVFENRFMHVPEMRRMGAQIKIEARSAIINGVPRVWGAPVKASDLRAGAALLLLALTADGVTDVTGLEHIDRGYVDIVGKLRSLGGEIIRVPLTQD
jgi:UDP-N-acetylglucosamine 1-carboxyvinyltransferase